MTTIPPFGELTSDERVPEWLVSQPIETGYFPTVRIRFVFVGLFDDPRPEELAEAAQSLLKLAVADRDRASPYVFKNYTDMLDACGPDDVDVSIANPAQVWAHVFPTDIYVRRRHRRDAKVYVQVCAECDWEPEHGVQIVYREGRELCRVSDQDSHLTFADACDLPEGMDRIA